MPIDVKSDVQLERQGRSVEHLQELYTVVVAIALSLVVARLIPEPGKHLQAESVAVSLALLFTLIPFYHGALRHLDDQYVSGLHPPSRGFAVLVDFFVLFLESVVFLTLSVLIERPTAFAWVFVSLLALDITWVYLTTHLLAREMDLSAQRAWRNINVVAGALLSAFLLFCDHRGTLSYAILVIAIARSAADYAVTWRFYAAAPNGNQA